VSVVNLHGRVEQRFQLEHPPGIAFRYFARNEDLLKQFLGADRVENLENGVYRVKLNPHGAMGLTIQPSFDVQFIEHAPNRVEMKSLGARLVQSSHDDAGFKAHFEGEALFLPDPVGCRVNCWARMRVELALPGFLAWMPPAPLEAIGNGIIAPAMQALAMRLVPLMQRDIARWVAAHPELSTR
jgi:Protein of unknown function (DUF1997)